MTSCFVDITTHLSIANKNMKLSGQPTQQENQTQQGTSQLGQSEEVYYPVFCQHCSTEVAVYDSEEVYHFFNVLTAH